jgi:hypothetical protein
MLTNYAVQLDARIIPELGGLRLRDIRPSTGEHKRTRRGVSARPPAMF